MAKNKNMSVGVLGLGSMGMGVARTLLKKGFKVHAFDVRREALQSLRRAGGTVGGTAADVGANVSVLIVLVVNAEQTDAALDEPPVRLDAARRAAGISAETFFVMKHGETRKLAPLMRQDARLDATAHPVA